MILGCHYIHSHRKGIEALLEKIRRAKQEARERFNASFSPDEWVFKEEYTVKNGRQFVLFRAERIGESYED